MIPPFRVYVRGGSRGLFKLRHIIMLIFTVFWDLYSHCPIMNSFYAHYDGNHDKTLFVFTFAGDSCEDGERSNCEPSPVGHTIDRLWLKRIKAMKPQF